MYIIQSTITYNSKITNEPTVLISYYSHGNIFNVFGTKEEAKRYETKSICLVAMKKLGLMGSRYKAVKL